MNPTVSVIIPIFNIEQYIRAALESVLRQEGPELEVLCVDDASSDRSMQVVEAVIQQNASGRIVVRLLRQPQNCGVSAARNLGIIQSRAKYLYFMDGDDLLFPGALAQLAEQMEKSQADFVAGDHMLFPDGATPMPNEQEVGKMDLFEGERHFQAFGRQIPVIVCNKMFWRDLLVGEALFFTPGVPHGEDYLFSFQVTVHSRRSGKLNRVTYAYRQRSNSCCFTFGRREVLGYRLVFARLFAQLPVIAWSQLGWAIRELETKRHAILADVIYYLPRKECREMMKFLRCFRFPVLRLLAAPVTPLRKVMLLVFYLNLPLCRILYRLRFYYYPKEKK